MTEDETVDMAASFAAQYRWFVGDKYGHDAEVDAETLWHICTLLIAKDGRVKELEAELAQRDAARVKQPITPPTRFAQGGFGV
jgi:hypothetical protein